MNDVIKLGRCFEREAVTVKQTGRGPLYLSSEDAQSDAAVLAQAAEEMSEEGRQVVRELANDLGQFAADVETAP